MLDVNTTSTNDRDIVYHTWRLETSRSSELPEQDKEASVKLKSENGFGMNLEDSRIEEGIQRSELSDQFDVRNQSEVSGAFHASLWRVESPTSNADFGQIYQRIVLGDLLDQFGVIAQRKDNWDGYESKKPNKLSLDYAQRFMEEFVDAIVSGGHSWLTPLLSSDEDGHITVEWYGKGRQLHLQIEEDEVVYIQVWGPNIETEMHLDTLYGKDYLRLWKWLLYE